MKLPSIFSNLSLITKISISVAFPIIFMGAIATVIVFFQTRSLLLESETTNNTWIIKNQTDELSQTILSSSKRVKNISLDPHITDFIQTLENKNPDPYESTEYESAQSFLKTVNLGAEFEFISIMDRNGIVSVSSQEEPDRSLSFDYRFYFQEAMEDRAAYEIAVGINSSELGLFLSQPIYNSSGDIQAVAVGKINLQSFLPPIIDHLETSFDNVMLTDKNGVIVYSLDKNQQLHSLMPLPENIYQDLKKQKRYPGIRGRSFNLSSHFQLLNQYSQPSSLEIGNQLTNPESLYISQIREMPFYLIAEKNLYPIYWQSMISSSILSLVVGFAAIIALSAIFIFINKVLKPLPKIIELARHISRGNYSHRIDIPGVDEFSILAKTGNQIAESLQKNQEILDEKISEQTSELEDQKRALANVLEDVQIEKQQALKSASELKKFQLAVENSSDLIVITGPDGKVVYTNSAIKRVTGYDSSEALGKKAGTLWGGLMTKEFYKDMWEAISVKKQEYECEIKNRRKNGEIFMAKISITPVLDKNGEVIFFVSVQRDITKEYEVNRMKTEFISLASHQLRTPLSAMRWYLEMLKSGEMGELKPEQKEIVDNINDSNLRMIVLVNSLLNVSRIESGRIMIEPENTDLTKLAEQIIAEFKPQISNKKITLKLEAEKELPSISIDPKLISEALKNLISNAVKYTPANKQITIKLKKENPWLIFEVSDQGYGIPEKNQGHLFEKFYRAENVRKMETTGTGLGLYLTKLIIQASNGEISFTSQEGKGSVFTLKLPLSGSEPKKGEVSLTAEPVNTKDMLDENESSKPSTAAPPIPEKAPAKDDKPHPNKISKKTTEPKPATKITQTSVVKTPTDKKANKKTKPKTKKKKKKSKKAAT